MSNPDPKDAEPTIQIVASRWLSRFEKCIRQRDYVNAEAMCHRNCVGFGLASDFLPGVDEWKLKEWREVWPEQVAFTFDQGSARLIFEHGLILASLPWVAQGRIEGAPPKRGRATIALMLFEDEKVKAVHFHFSRDVEDKKPE